MSRERSDVTTDERGGAISLNGETRLFPILGDPVAYVESPARFSETLAQRGANSVCVPLHVTEAEFGTVLAGLSVTENVDGVLITMPHKFRAREYCDTISSRVEVLGAVSVMRRTVDRAWHGDMLDGLAFVSAQVTRGAVVAGRRALLLGAGGAGRAIALALLEAGIEQVRIFDPDDEHRRAVLALGTSFGPNRLESGPPDPTGYDLIFNATPLGMHEGDCLPLDPSLLQGSMFVGDVVAGHGETPLIRAARAAGCATATGSDMVDAVQSQMADFMLGLVN